MRLALLPSPNPTSVYIQIGIKLTVQDAVSDLIFPDVLLGGRCWVGGVEEIVAAQEIVEE